MDVLAMFFNSADSPLVLFAAKVGTLRLANLEGKLAENLVIYLS